MYDKYHNGENLDALLSGKVSLDYLPIVTKWQEQGLAQDNSYRNFAFDTNENENQKLDFILKNLK